MRFSLPCIAATLLAVSSAQALETDYAADIERWRQKAEKSLRADNGWLTLAGRYVLKPGVNSIGVASSNDIVLPPGLAPEKLGTLVVEKGKATLSLADGVTMTAGGKNFSGKRLMKTKSDKRDWVALGRMAMHVIKNENRFILRLADNHSEMRKNFTGREWYEVKEPFRVEAKFLAYPKGKTVPIVNVIDEVTDEVSPGYVEFKIGGQDYRLDAVGEDKGLFFVFRDLTASDTTYHAGRFLYVEKKPKSGQSLILDFNKAYNPPCAFSEFTTCPLPPEQNRLKVRIEAGEKFRAKQVANLGYLPTSYRLGTNYP